MKTDHKAAFLAAVKGVPNHVVTRVLNEFTPGTSWTRCGKEHIAECYEKAKGPNPVSHETDRFKKLTDLVEFRRALLVTQAAAVKDRADRKAADERQMAAIKTSLKAKKEQQELAARMIAAVDAIEARINTAPSYGMAYDIQQIINSARKPT